MNIYKVISLFSGVGGSSLGYKMAGFNVIAAVEFIDYQAHNYRLNNKNTKVFEEDIRILDLKNVLKDMKLKEGELDILDGSPPCSSFSKAGKKQKLWGKIKQYSNKKQRTDDLFFEYIKFLRKIKPKVFVAENVKGLIEGPSKGYFKMIIKELKESDYNVKCKLMNTKYYNVPQSRERVIFIGVRKDLKIIPSYPIPNNKIITIRKAWKNIKNKTYGREISEKERLILEQIKPGNQLSKGYIKLYKKNNYFTHYKISYNKVSPCILQGSKYFHPEELRLLTIEELKRIVTFSDDFKLEGDYYKQKEACGRAVPPKFMQAIAENIKLNILDKYNNK